MSSLVSESTPSRFAFASAALNLASLSCSTVLEPPREGTEVFVGGCSGFLCGSGAEVSAELALVGWHRPNSLTRFHRTCLCWLARLTDPLRRFHRTRFNEFWRPLPRLCVHPARRDRLRVHPLLRTTTTVQWKGNGQNNNCTENAHNQTQKFRPIRYAVPLTTIR